MYFSYISEQNLGVAIIFDFEFIEKIYNSWKNHEKRTFENVAPSA